jgi:hypothetical protein
MNTYTIKWNDNQKTSKSINADGYNLKGYGEEALIEFFIYTENSSTVAYTPIAVYNLHHVSIELVLIDGVSLNDYK